MQHADYLVDILDTTGTVVGQKPRREVDKRTDIYNTAYVQLVLPNGALALTAIPSHTKLPNIYIGQLGTPVATIRRHQETAQAAATRVAEQKFYIKNAAVRLIGESLQTCDDGRINMMSLFALRHDIPAHYDTKEVGELTILTPAQISAMLTDSPERFAPTFRVLWRLYGAKFQG